MKKQQKILNEFFLLTWKKFFWLLILWILAVFIHNAIYALFYSYYSQTGGEESIFFIIAIFVIPFYFLVCVIYTLVKKCKWRLK